MRNILLRSTARALFRSGGNYHRSFSTAVIVQPRHHQHGGDTYGNFYWQRMSTLPEKKDQQTEENKNDANNSGNNSKAVVSSYWGISRPKVLKEDGTEWPWNCFMVRIHI